MFSIIMIRAILEITENSQFFYNFFKPRPNDITRCDKNLVGIFQVPSLTHKSCDSVKIPGGIFD